MGERREIDFGSDIAIIGMAGRFPGAGTVGEFWQRILEGAETISRFSVSELRAAGVSEEEASDPLYVGAGGVVEGCDLFDAEFFGFNPREAEILDPQQRMFLEVSWEALEAAGYDAGRYGGPIGVYAGVGMNSYLMENLMRNREVVATVHPYHLMLASDKDFLATRVSYKLNLRGPGVTVQTACSTSLVAVHFACQGLLGYECDMALAGGVSVIVPQRRGYRYQEGGIGSPDGHCRPFDAGARGTVSGNGLGVVVLKRLGDAVTDGDHIHAVIRATSINNDGARKAGYTAPSVEGQAEAIATALSLAGVSAESIGYVEAHGTGTPLGDPIEMAALTQAYRQGTSARGYCAIGSVKANIGHLNTAAGVTGLIKAALAVEKGKLPPEINFSEPNPALRIGESPFFVSGEAREWVSEPEPRRAAVSSFGIGGTNAHVIIEQAPAVEARPMARRAELLPISARTREALEAATVRLTEHLRRGGGEPLADVAWTLQVGRQAMRHRRVVIGADRDVVLAKLEAGFEESGLTSVVGEETGPAVFLFPGQGTQYVGMGRELYATAPAFREQLDRCTGLLAPLLKVNPSEVLYPSMDGDGDGGESASRLLGETWLTQPLLFAVEYSMARLLESAGIRPAAAIGHSLGEYVAACLAGVFTLEDALRLVVARGRLMQSMPAGSMLAVPLGELEVLEWLDGDLSLAAINGERSCVVSGASEAIGRLELRLAERGIEGRRLLTSHAFHSSMMNPVVEEFRREVAQVELRAPAIPFISNVTGRWITEGEATDPGYWARHLREAVRFADGLSNLLTMKGIRLVEVGPGQVLTGLARQHPHASRETLMVATMRRGEAGRGGQGDRAQLLEAVGRLWLTGSVIDWEGVSGDERRRRVPLPGYPFERRRYWVEPTGDGGVRRAGTSEWLYQPAWIRRRGTTPGGAARRVLLLGAGGREAGWLEQMLTERGCEVVGTEPLGSSDWQYHCERLLGQLERSPKLPASICFDGRGMGEAKDGLERLLALIRAIGRRGEGWPLRLDVITDEVAEVTGDEELKPEQAVLAGLCRVIPMEMPWCECRHIDLGGGFGECGGQQRHTQVLIDELLSSVTDPAVAVRGGHRWVQVLEPLAVAGGGEAMPSANSAGKRDGGVVLITGGLGRIGLALAEHLARQGGRDGRGVAGLALIGRREFPERGQWEAWLSSHDEGETTSTIIRRLMEIEAAGTRVAVKRVDVADERLLEEAVGRVEHQLGPIDGVVHAAGELGDSMWRPLVETTSEEIARQFRSKVDGTMALARVLEGRQPGFCMLMSSLSTVLGGWGYGAYAAANAFLDSFAQRQRQLGRPWISVDWDGWRFADDRPPSSLKPASGRGTMAELAMSPREGVEAFSRLLSLTGLERVVVSTADPRARVAWLQAATLPRQDGRTGAAASGRPAQMAARESGVTSLHPRPTLTSDYVEPADEIERRIAAIWSEVLGIGRIGADDNFFELGGHSLLATQVVSRLRDEYRVEFPLREIFERPTVAGLAGLVRLGSGGGAATSTMAMSPIVPIPRDGELPLSYAQQRLWFLDRLEPGSPLYNNPAALRLTGRLDVVALTQSLNLVVARHEPLRTVFASEAGRPVARILQRVELAIPVIDLTALAEAEREAEVTRLAASEATHSFDLASGPLLRLTLLREREDEHLALITIHHIASDGWSIGVLIREMATAYRAIVAGEEPVLPVLPIQYVDFAQSQRQWLEQGAKTAQLDYWRRRLSDPSRVLDLTTDWSRPARQTYRGATRWESLPIGPRRSLEALAQRENSTLFMGLLAVFATLLHRYTGETEIRVGSPVAGRRQAETEGLIGCFINPLVLSADLAGDPTFGELLQRVREMTLEAYAHQDLPFEMLVEALQPERDLTHSPLFQVMLVLQNAPQSVLDLPGLRIEEVKTERGTEKFDLTLFVEELADGLRLGWSWNTDLFTAATIERMARHFRQLLEAVITTPEKRISDLPLLASDERARMDEWNRLSPDGGDEEPPPLVARSIEAMANLQPEAIAVECGEERLSFGDLVQRAAGLGHLLRQMTGRAGMAAGGAPVVAVCLDRTVEAVVALQAILGAGAVWLPIDPGLPAERVAFMLTDSGAAAILTRTSVEAAGGSLEGYGLPVLRVDDPAEVESPRGMAATDPDPSRPACLIYTSGSTGQPKGVLTDHGALASHCRTIVRHYGLSAADRVLQFSSFSFDPSLEQIIPTLMVGGTVVMRDGDPLPPGRFARFVAEQRLSVVNLPPAYWRQWVEFVASAPEAASPDAVVPRLVVVGGDVMTPDVLEWWRRTPLSTARLLNAYGPTETTVTALTCEVTAEREAPRGRRIPIGRPLPGRTAWVVDERLRPVPIGVPGELCLGGEGVAQGYLGRPELTRERFLADPFTSRPGARLYRTGDLARWLDDGEIEFLGRRDRQVKIRGMRVELDEIEAALARHPRIRQAAVVRVDGADGEARLHAWYVPVEGSVVEDADLRGWMKRELPEFMVPASCCRIAAIAMTAGGKVDRRALPTYEPASEPGGEDEEPRGETEQRLAMIWAELLGLERVGRHRNFFDLGGHSLLATRLMSRIEQSFGLDLPLRSLFEAPTVADLASLIATRLTEGVDAAELDRLLAEIER